MTSRTLAAAVLLFAGALVGQAEPSVQAAAGSPCDRFTAGEEAGRVLDPAITEASGIVASRIHPAVLWVHNDSGGEPMLFAMSETGSIVGTHRVANAEAIDWEDIAVGPGPRRHDSYLFVGDIGSNFRDREFVTVYRFPEPAPGGETTVADVNVLRLRYPGGTVDAEALLVDPISGDLYILTKETGRSRVMRAPRKHLRSTGVITLEEVGSFEVGPDYPVDPARGRLVPASPLPGTLVTAADVSLDGTMILVRTYQEVLAFSRDPKSPLETAFASPPCLASQRDEPQGEAVGFAADGCAYYTIGELVAAPLHRFGPVEGVCS